MSLMEIITLFSAVAFLIYGLEYATGGVDSIETIGGIALVILSIGLLATFIYS